MAAKHQTAEKSRYLPWHWLPAQPEQWHPRKGSHWTTETSQKTNERKTSVYAPCHMYLLEAMRGFHKARSWETDKQVKRQKVALGTTQLSLPFQTWDSGSFYSDLSSPKPYRLPLFLSLNKGVQLPVMFPLTSKAMLSMKHFFPSSVSQHCRFSGVRHLNPTKDDVPGACSLPQILFLRHLKLHTSHLVTRGELSATESLPFPLTLEYRSYSNFEIPL